MVSVGCRGVEYYIMETYQNIFFVDLMICGGNYNISLQLPYYNFIIKKIEFCSVKII